MDYSKPKGLRKNMTHITCKLCNHFGLIVLRENYRTKKLSFSCIKCKRMFE